MNSPKHFDKNNILVRLVKNELTNLFCYQARKKGIDHVSERLKCSIRSYEIATQQANLLLAFLSSLDWCLRFSYFIGIELSIYSILPIFIYASLLTHRKVYFFLNNGKYLVNDAIGMLDEHRRAKKKLRTLEITRNTFFSIYISYHRNLFITSK